MSIEVMRSEMAEPVKLAVPVVPPKAPSLRAQKRAPPWSKLIYLRYSIVYSLVPYMDRIWSASSVPLAVGHCGYVSDRAVHMASQRFRLSIVDDDEAARCETGDARLNTRTSLFALCPAHSCSDDWRFTERAAPVLSVKTVEPPPWLQEVVSERGGQQVWRILEIVL